MITCDSCKKSSIDPFTGIVHFPCKHDVCCMCLQSRLCASTLRCPVCETTGLRETPPSTQKEGEIGKVYHGTLPPRIPPGAHIHFGGTATYPWYLVCNCSDPNSLVFWRDSHSYTYDPNGSD